MDWNDLRYFLAISRAGTLAGAARGMGVDHTTVGRRLSALEATLGVRLFARGPDGFALSEAGAEILPNVEAIEREAEGIARRIAGGDTRVEGRVRLSVADSVTGYFIEMLARLRARYPGLVVELSSANRAVDIRRGEADLAVRFGDAGDPELIARKIGRVGWSLYAAPAYLGRKGTPASVSDVAGHDVIAIDELLPPSPPARWLAEHAAVIHVVLRGNTISALVEAAQAGMGLAALPCFIADAEPDLVRISPALIGARDILLVAHPDLTRAARMRVTMDFIAETFERDRSRWAGE